MCYYPKIKKYCFLFAACCILSASPVMAQIIYSNHFEDPVPVGVEWSNTSTAVTPLGSRTFLGQFSNETVSLTLPDPIPAYNVRVSFDLFIILTWDGHTNGEWSPDVWDLSVAGGPTLLHTTFATINHSATDQSYPGTYVAVDAPPFNPPNSRAAEVNTLGYFRNNDPELPMDAVYGLSFTFPHVGGPLVLDFSGIGLQGVGDESWGLDNVLVEGFIPVQIDIKPGSFPNSINPNAGGVIPVAILTTDVFDATTVDPMTVALEGASARGKGKSGNYGSFEDVDGDGDLDLVVQVVNEINWAENTTEATLTGQTWDGIPIEGTDSVNIVPPEQ